MFNRHSANTPWGRSLLWVATAPLLVATALVFERDGALLAQSPNPLEGVEIPTSIEPGSRLNIDSSEAMRLVNEALRSRFSSQYGDADVEVNYDSADNSIQDLIDGNIDLAAIGRNLTDAEISAGLRELGVSRSKIAILVSPDNPFAGSLTIDQFAQIFRGEITNWSEVGGQDAPIVLVDHPDNSDTRQAFRNYPVLANAPFAAAPGAVTLDGASADAIAGALDENSISYLVAEQALNNPAVKIVPMHETLPDDPRYPFSQPLAYVYNPEVATPATLAFLGFAVNPDNEALIEAARAAATAEPTAAAEPTAEPEPVAEATSETTVEETAPVAPAPARGLPWWPWLLALSVLGGLLWWLLKGAAPVAAPLAAATRDRRIILTPRNCRDAYAYWELPEAEVDALKQQNYTLALKLHDVTDIANVDSQAPHSTHQSDCDTLAVGDRHLPIGVDDRDYLVELGYVGSGGDWHALARSAHGRVPACPSPVAPAAPGIGAATAARVVLTPRDGKNAYAYWELPPSTVDDLRAGSRSLKARLYDVTELPGNGHGLNSLQEFNATLETPGDLHLPIAIDDRNYLVEIGYVNSNYQWQTLAKSEPVRVPAADTTHSAVQTAAAGVGFRSDLGAESKIILVPRTADAAYAYWEAAPAHKSALVDDGGRVLALRIHDATHLELDYQPPHATQEYILPGGDTDRHVPIPVPDRDYVAELGYLTDDGQWLQLVRSLPVRIPAA